MWSRCVVGMSSLVVFVGSAPGQDAATLVKRGATLAKQNKFKAALVPLSSAAATAPDNVEAQRWLGHCHNALGMHRQALVNYNRAIEIDPRFAWAWYARGMARHHLNQWKSAVVDYTKALELDPGHHKAIEWRGFNRGLLGDHVGAYLDFTNAVRLDPENPWVYFARGKAAVNLGSFDRAEKDFRRALLLDPKDPATHAQLGFVLTAKGESAAALESLDAAIRLDPRRQEYSRLWRYWLQASSGKLGQDVRANLPARGWHGHLSRVLLGELTRAQILQRVALDDIDPEVVRTRRCEAAFYLGLRSLLVKKFNRAREHFKEALTHGDMTVPEWRVAHRLARR